MIKDVKAYLEAGEAAKTKRVSRLAVRVAEDLEVPLDAIQGTGVGGRVMKEDVLREAERTQEKPQEDHPAVEKEPVFGSAIPLTKMRNAISRRMSQSAFTAPHIYLFTEIAVQNLLDLRQSILTEFEQRFGVRPSVNDFVLKAAALTILEHPLFNATLKDDGIHVHPEINVGLAVALEDGLIVPAIPNTDQLGLGSIAQKRSELVEKARQGRLTISEVDIGTFTISSLASSNVHFFSAILNPPQSGILSMGKTREQLHLEEGEIKATKVIGFGLSVDHRIIDGAMGAGFLETFERKIQNPACLLL
jgi:pyruvate dehydrogenase E2 component (dihydrolipoamide acetyltransferase)